MSDLSPPHSTFGFRAALGGAPPLMWMAELYVSCPKCTEDADFGHAPGHGVVISCRKCEWSMNLPDIGYEELRSEMLNEAARQASEQST